MRIGTIGTVVLAVVAVSFWGCALETADDIASGETLCTDTCRWAGDGECDDGGSGSLYSVCEYGTDCMDCGPREGTGGSGGDPSGCNLTCSGDGFYYSCASSSSTTTYSYCSNGNPSSVRVAFSNGHTVTCTLNCSGWGGTCRDDTGESCSL